MNLKKLSLIILAGALLVSTNSCKEEDETTALPALKGYLEFSVPAYVKPNTKIKMTPRGVTHPDDKGLGYYWKVSPTMSKYDTTRFVNGLDKYGNPSDGSFTHTFSDTLKTYTVYAYAYAEGYSASPASNYCSVVSGGLEESITNLNISKIASSNQVIDGKTYYYTTIGGNDWMMTNIADTKAGAPYFNCTAMSDVFGRYYSYEDALTICPEGWTLPTDADWVALAKAAGADSNAETFTNISGVAARLMGNAYFNDKRMWEYWPAVGDITNETGMSIIPTGFAMLGAKADNAKEDPNLEYNYPNALFKGSTEYACFWTANAVQNEEGMAYYRYFICNQPSMMIGKADQTTFGASVRCIRKK